MGGDVIRTSDLETEVTPEEVIDNLGKEEDPKPSDDSKDPAEDIVEDIINDDKEDEPEEKPEDEPDKKEDPKEDPKEDEPEEPAKEDEPEDEPSEEADDAAKKVEDLDPSQEISDEDLDKMLSDLEDSNEKVTEDLEEDFTPEKAKEALAQKDGIIKTLGDKLEKYISDNARMGVDLAEAKMYSPSKVNEVVVLTANIEKALEGDTDSIDKVLNTLTSLRSQLTSKTFEEEEMEKENDRISKAGKMSGKSDPKKVDFDGDEGGARVL